MLSKPVSEIMHEGVITCAPDTPLPDVARTMTRHDVSAIVVVEEDGSLAGIISRTDLLVLYGYDEMWPHLQAGQVMIRSVITVEPTASAVEAARKLHEHKIHRLIVTDSNGHTGKVKPIGVLSITDIVRDMSLV